MPSTSFLEMLLAGAAFSISGSLTISLGFVYSKENNGGFCLPCVLFATGYRGHSNHSHAAGFLYVSEYPDPAEDPVYPVGNILHC